MLRFRRDVPLLKDTSSFRQIVSFMSDPFSHANRKKELYLFFRSSFQKRYKHQNAHRTIAVKLLEDIPGVGERCMSCVSMLETSCHAQTNSKKASIQSVAPGRMRHVFYPRKQAAYITERPRKDVSVCPFI